MAGTISDLGTDLAGDGFGADQAVKLLGYASIGFGVAGMLAPTTLRRSYGMSTGAAPGELTYLGRMWGSRTAVLGAFSLAARTAEDQRRVLMLGAGMNAFDALTAATTAQLPPRSRLMGALTSGFFAAAAAYGASSR